MEWLRPEEQMGEQGDTGWVAVGRVNWYINQDKGEANQVEPDVEIYEQGV